VKGIGSMLSESLAQRNLSEDGPDQLKGGDGLGHFWDFVGTSSFKLGLPITTFVEGS
jgi:hypothetical protein